MPQTPTTKRCLGPCGLELPIEDFHRDKTQSGYKARCKKCRAAGDKRRVRGTAPDAFPSATAFEADECLLAAIEAGGESLIAFGLPIERVSAESLLRAGSVAEAALELQLDPRQLRAHLSELQRRAASRGYSPAHDMSKSTPEGFHVKGTSTYYKIDPDTGESSPIGQWVKTNKDESDRVQRLLDAMSTIADRWEGLAEPVAVPEHAPEDLLVAFVMGDPHFGMFSWAPETGSNWDLKIAEETLYTAVDRLVEIAPAAAQALVVNVGDFYHADNRGNTTTGGTPVDSDGRWPKVLSTGVRLVRRFNDRVLEKFGASHNLMEIGNHDWHSAIMLSICLSQYYEREPRVTVDTSPAKFHSYRFGQNLIATTHGDTIKLTDLGEIMATDLPKDWGETRHRHWITGHVHHDQVKELRGCTVRTVRTLAPPDAWHKGKGYRSGRDMKALVFHRELGLIKELFVGIDEIESILRSRAAGSIT